MTNEKRPLVVVLSRNYSTGLGIIRSLGETGRYEIDLVASTAKKGKSVITAGSRFLRKAGEVISAETKGSEGAELLEALMAYEGAWDGPMVLFPTDDFTASVADRHKEALEKIFRMPHVAPEQKLSITELMDKTVQGKLAEQAGLDTPEEWIISLKEEIVIPEDMVYPCFVKPLQSITGQKTEMRACAGHDELAIHLKTMQQTYRDREVLVQEFLDIEKEYDLSGVCIDQKIIIPAIIEKTHVAQHKRGVTMAGRVISAEAMGEDLKKAEEMLKLFRFTGMVDMEFIVSGGRIYFNEVNLRSGGPNFSYYLCGSNLPAVVADELLYGTHREEEENVRDTEQSFVYERVAWEDYINGYMTKEELDGCIEGADHTLLSYDNDPEPGKIFRRRIRLSAVKHRLLQLAGKEKKRHG